TYVSLPDVAEHLAAHAGLDRRASGHDAPRGGQDAGAEPCQHVRDAVAPEIDAPTGTTDPLEAGDDPLAMRTVLEEQAQRSHAFSAARGLLEELESLNVALVLEDARDLDFDAGQRHVDARVLGRHGVADPREHVSNGVGHLISISSPAALRDAGDIA